MINISTIKAIISEYKQRFSHIHNVEIYKWEAVQWFQDNWRENATDFKEMLLIALDRTGELMDVERYFPKRMLTEFLKHDPSAVRALFSDLYDETLPLSSRLANFIEGMAELLKKYVPDRNHHFQDTRAAMVYLTLRYPEKYFLYKFTMYTEFAKQVQYPHYINHLRAVQNVLLFQTLCEIVCEYVGADHELLQMHQRRLKDHHYPDTSYHLLTQDIIYASTHYFSDIVVPDTGFTVTVMENHQMTPHPQNPALKGRHVEYLKRAMELKNLGEMGEQVVLDFEIEKLKRAGIAGKLPRIASKLDGDGLGYDVDSFDENGKPIFIEVKTAKSAEAPFFITNAELKKSILSEKTYFLYRLYDFNLQARSCKMIIHRGSLEKFCINPVAYIVPYNIASVFGE